MNAEELEIRHMFQISRDRNVFTLAELAEILRTMEALAPPVARVSIRASDLGEPPYAVFGVMWSVRSAAVAALEAGDG